MTTIVWRGILYNSLEYLQLSEADDGIFVKSKIIGTTEGKIYFIEYELTIDKEWKVSKFDISVEVNNNRKRILGIKRINEWEVNGVINPQFADFNFIDISLTPFTNTLPIRNLHLNNTQEQEINVIYIDILEGLIKPAKQKYRRNSALSYHYENIPNDFEADIDVDESGFVKFYPELFKRITWF